VTESPGTNPYEAPREEAERAARPGSGAALDWTISDALEFGFRRTLKNPLSIVIAFLAFVVPTVPMIVLEFVWLLPRMQSRPEDIVQTVVVFYAALIALMPIQLYLMLGLLRFSLASARGRPAGFAEAVAPTNFLPFLGAYILWILAIDAGLLFCVVPGVFLMCAWALFGALICDGREGAISSFSKSWQMTRGQRGKLFLFGLVAMCVILAGYLALCVGVLFALPVINHAYAYVYLRMSGEQPVEATR
jgi:hypothetical protein